MRRDGTDGGTEVDFMPAVRGKDKASDVPQTELKAFPLFCPKCRQESLISVKNFRMETANARR